MIDLDCLLKYSVELVQIIVPLLIAFFAFFAFLRYGKDLLWRRSEFLAKQVLEFERDPSVGIVQSLLEYHNRAITIPAHDSWTGLISLTPSSEAVAWALRGRIQQETDILSAGEYAVRDAFDRFLWYLGHFQTMANAAPKLINHEELWPYLKFWCELLTGENRLTEGTRIPSAVWSYASEYWTDTAYELLTSKEFKLKIPAEVKLGRPSRPITPVEADWLMYWS